jgi:hypothetical protein
LWNGAERADVFSSKTCRIIERHPMALSSFITQRIRKFGRYLL